jgi:endonuclease III
MLRGLPVVQAGTSREKIARLVDRFGRRFSAELDITLDNSDKDEVFRWFVASILFGARISEKIAIKTYRKFMENNLDTVDRIVEAGWDKLVEVLDSGGYARYDFKTATKILEVMKNLRDRYGGNLCQLHAEASNPSDLEMKIKQLGKGIGDVTVSIFLRELRGIWRYADPPLQELAVTAARSLGLTRREGKDEAEKLAILKELQRLWSRNRIKGKSFIDFETALVRYGKDVLRKKMRGSIRSTGR